MEIIHAIILGIVQGLTEFLPVSSSGHIIIANYFLSTNYNPNDNFEMTIVLHAATAASTIYVFRKDISEILIGLVSKNTEKTHFSVKILLSMIPAVLVGLVWEDKINKLYQEGIYLIGVMLIITAILLFLADKSRLTTKRVSILGSIVIGISQAIALIPGLSRSGATISTSVLLGFDKESSAKFSFLMVLPLILGVMVKKLFFSQEDIQLTWSDSLPLIFGFFTAFIVGMFACKWMIQLVKNSRLSYFAYYCILLGLCIIFYQYIDA